MLSNNTTDTTNSESPKLLAFGDAPLSDPSVLTSTRKFHSDVRKSATLQSLLVHAPDSIDLAEPEPKWTPEQRTSYKHVLSDN
mmetsp:Transcript_23494/g.35682  ORF Transcript_23494/g.35682 Transcript_23494/m.35682 type:complete len:83 (+) Transcript_23494:2198-2446(+)